MNVNTADLIKAKLSEVNGGDKPTPPTPPTPPANDNPPADDKGTPPTPPAKDTPPADPANPNKDESDKDIKIEVDTKKFQPVPYEKFKKLNESNKELTERIKELESKIAIKEQDDSDDGKARKELKKLGMLDKDEAELEDLKRQQGKLAEDNVRHIEREIEKMEKDFDGSDGLPKFERKEVIERGITNNIYDPKSAYIMMNLNTIINSLVKKEVDKIKSLPNFGVKQQNADDPSAKTDVKKLSIKDGSLKEFLTDRLREMTQ